MKTFKFWLFIFCCLFEIKTFLLILQTFLTFATKHGADGALPGCITRYPRYQICIPLRYFRRITLVACHLQTWESELCESIPCALAEVSHDEAKWNERRETSAGYRRVVWWSRRPNFWSKLTSFQNRFRLMCTARSARALLDCTLTIIEPTVDYCSH